MVEFVAVLPAIHHDDTLRCVESMHWDLARDRLLLVDNGAGLDCDDIDHLVRWHIPYDGTNRGVPASWNLGIELARERRADYLLLLSHSIEFGDAGGLDLIDELDRSPKHGCGTQFGWKCVAVGRPCWETIGLFDPVFSPGYGEDSDYLRRLGCAGLPSPRENGMTWPQFMVDAISHGDGLSMKRGLLGDSFDYQHHLRAYETKWLGAQGAETTCHPYGDESLDFTFVGPRP